MKNYQLINLLQKLDPNLDVIKAKEITTCCDKEIIQSPITIGVVKRHWRDTEQDSVIEIK